MRAGRARAFRHFRWYKGCGVEQIVKLFRDAKDSLAASEIRNLGVLFD
ncbi:MAG: hypothetical protein WBA97_30615 [Actinophytocola sp.]